MDRTRGTAFEFAREFARYIASRTSRSTSWPNIYDEMCRVARSREFRGMGYAELEDIGVSLSITGLERTCQLLDQAWDQGPDD
jgi:hypothetical protein